MLLSPSSCPYSPECVEGLFPELRAEVGSKKFVLGFAGEV